MPICCFISLHVEVVSLRSTKQAMFALPSNFVNVRYDLDLIKLLQHMYVLLFGICNLDGIWGAVWIAHGVGIRWGYFFYKSPKSIIQESGLIHQYILNVVRPYNQYMRMSIVIEGNRPPLFFVSVWASIFWLACLIWVFGDWIHTLVYLLSWSEKRKMKKICFCVVKVSLFYHSCTSFIFLQQ